MASDTPTFVFIDKAKLTRVIDLVAELRALARHDDDARDLAVMLLKMAAD